MTDFTAKNQSDAGTVSKFSEVSTTCKRLGLTIQIAIDDELPLKTFVVSADGKDLCLCPDLATLAAFVAGYSAATETAKPVPETAQAPARLVIIANGGIECAMSDTSPAPILTVVDYNATDDDRNLSRVGNDWARVLEFQVEPLSSKYADLV